MQYYEFHQNNSGGRFREPAYNVVVEVQGEHDSDLARCNADYLAEKAGVYFSGVSMGIDCSCCGDRWYPAYSSMDLEDLGDRDSLTESYQVLFPDRDSEGRLLPVVLFVDRDGKQEKFNSWSAFHLYLMEREK